MPNKILLDDPTLLKLVHQYSVGDFLFMQGDRGNTMFLVIEGSVVLFRKNQNTERMVAKLSAGEMLGEKAILQNGPYTRNFTAQAKTPVTVVEFDKNNLKLIQAKIPDFLMKLTRLLSERLDRTIFLVGILQSTDELERVVQYLAFFFDNFGTKVASGLEITLTYSDVSEAVNVKIERVTEIIDTLLKEKLLLKTKLGMVAPDVRLLTQNSDHGRERQAA